MIIVEEYGLGGNAMIIQSISMRFFFECAIPLIDV